MWDLYKGLSGLHLNTGNALLERERVYVTPRYTELAVTSKLLIFFS